MDDGKKGGVEDRGNGEWGEKRLLSLRTGDEIGEALFRGSVSTRRRISIDDLSSSAPIHGVAEEEREEAWARRSGSREGRGASKESPSKRIR